MQFGVELENSKLYLTTQKYCHWRDFIWVHGHATPDFIKRHRKKVIWNTSKVTNEFYDLSELRAFPRFWFTNYSKEPPRCWENVCAMRVKKRSEILREAFRNSPGSCLRLSHGLTPPWFYRGTFVTQFNFRAPLCRMKRFKNPKNEVKNVSQV